MGPGTKEFRKTVWGQKRQSDGVHAPVQSLVTGKIRVSRKPIDSVR